MEEFGRRWFRQAIALEYEVIAIARDVTASDVLPTGRHLGSAPGMRPQSGMTVCQFRSATGQRCGAVSSVGNGRFAMTDMAVDSRDFGGPVYALTDDDGALIVGLVEGTWRSALQIESWQAVMAQVYVDGQSLNAQRRPPAPGMIGWRASAFASP